MSDEQKVTVARAVFTAVAIILILLVLTLRLFQIQIIQGKSYSIRATNQRMLNLPLDFSRGQFYDANLIPLTGRERVDSLVVFPALIEDKDKAALMIAGMTGMEYKDALAGLQKASSPYKLPLKETREKENAGEGRGIMVIRDIERYDTMSRARHLIGYIDKRDKVGRAGLERLYEGYLTGDGEVSVAAMIDGSKRLIPGLGYKLVDGGRKDKRYDIQLTIDYHIQKKVEEVLDEYGIEGAAVVLDVEKGGVLAMASRPDYGQGNVERYLDGQRGELLNKALQQYNLGSIFKTVVAAAVLEDNLVNPFETVNCPGYIQVGDLQVKCSSYDSGGHGDLNIYQAYAQSCNTFFIEMGQRVGGERIIQLARAFGLGEIAGINPLEEQGGLLPPDKGLHKSDVCNISIGQGDILVTPLQVAAMTNTIANNGVDKSPYVVKGLIDDTGKTTVINPPLKPRRVISAFVATEIRRMMEMVVEDGTGSRAELPGPAKTAGKTSSAQTGQRSNGQDVVHAWFTGYTPRIFPKYVITVMAENGKSGGSVAAPVFRDIAQRLLELGDR
jgi:peptidoglycan glycosyltransferase/penicillin-binding protein 2